MHSLKDHIFYGYSKGINLKSSVMEYAALSRGLPVERLSNTLITVDTLDNEALAFHNMNGPHSSQPGRELCGRKDLAQKLMGEAGLRVPVSQTFSSRYRENAARFASTLNGPVVVKPVRLSKGKGVSTGILSPEEFNGAWKNAFDAHSTSSSRNRVIVQEQIFGEDYRVFVVDSEVISITQRRRPSVTGDGKSTLLALIKDKNKARKKHPTLTSFPIPEEADRLDNLARQGYSLDHVPSTGERVTLRRTSNLSGGGDSVDLTDTAHETYREMARRALAAIPGMRYGGVDLIVPDISCPPDGRPFAVTEVEFSPGPLTDFPVEGKPRDMGGAILGHYLKRD
jgi:D-alanine-D-alanine ligase-like ATP-grasp enzyme